jgi:hypothetical protein
MRFCLSVWWPFSGSATASGGKPRTLPGHPTYEFLRVRLGQKWLG